MAGLTEVNFKKTHRLKWSWLRYIDQWRGDKDAGWFAFTWNARRRPVRRTDKRNAVEK